MIIEKLLCEAINKNNLIQMAFGRFFLMVLLPRKDLGASILFISPSKESFPFSYKLNYETTNNVVEYEALFLDLKRPRK
jgi:hypothetical protein